MSLKPWEKEWTVAPAGTPLDRALAAEGLDADPKFAPLARSVYGQESSSGANTATSNRGAVGGMQILPSTFLSVADRGWDIRNEDHNARAGVRYLKQGYDKGGGDPKLAAAWYYGGPGGQEKARAGVAVSDPKNPKAPNTLQYGDQVVARMGASGAVSGPTAAPAPEGGGQVPAAPRAPATSLTQASGAMPERLARIRSAGAAFAAAPVAAAPAAAPEPAALKPWEKEWEVESEAAPAPAPGAMKAIAGGLGAGVGKVALGAQHWVGKGMQGVGLDKAGQWLVDDAASGRARIDQEMAPLKEAHPFAAGVGGFGGEVVATLPVGGVFGKGVMAAAPHVAKVAPAVAQWMQKFGVALETGGLKTGAPTATTLTGKTANLGTRMAGGAVAGGAAAGLADPEHVGTGAVIGGMTPPILGAAGKAAHWTGSVVRDMALPAQAATAAQKHYAQRIAESLGAPVDDVLAALDAAQRGPSMIPGYQPTVPQIFQKPELSQLQRTIKNAGGQALGDAEQVQQSQYREALDRIAPAADTVNEAANRAGTAIGDFAGNANAEALAAVAGAASKIDPDDLSRILLPREEMAAARDKFLGEGTFGSGRDAQTALNKAAEVGTEVLPAVDAARPVPMQTVAQAVRKAGGIRGTGGEVRDLGIRESGTTGLVNNKSGNAADLLAEEMARRGYLDEADPDALIDALRGGLAGGKQRIAFDAPDDVMRGMFERATMGAEGLAEEVVDKPVSFETMQNLRSSMLERARAAEALGNARESSALNSMVFELDKHLDALGRGELRTGEFFPGDMNHRFREMTGLKRDQVQRFETGPQYGMFRKGADGQPAIQGAEIPPKFFSGNRSQVEDMEAFRRLIGDDPALLAPELKRYALTEGQATANQAGDLTGKFGRWADSRSGAIGGLFDEGERATIGEVRKAVDRGISAENLGRATGSNTAQNLQSLQGLGMLDNRVIDVLANRIPGIGSLTGPMLQGLRETAKRTKNDTLAALLASPDEFAKALRAGQIKPDRRLLEALEAVEPLLYRSAPLALTN